MPVLNILSEPQCATAVEHGDRVGCAQVRVVTRPRARADVAVFGTLYSAPQLFPRVRVNDLRPHGFSFLAIARGCPGLSTRSWMQVLWR
nr:MAG TPA: hypothetical protein [Caudoviricetes sp.]